MSRRRIGGPRSRGRCRGKPAGDERADAIERTQDPGITFGRGVLENPIRTSDAVPVAPHLFLRASASSTGASQ